MCGVVMLEKEYDSDACYLFDKHFIVRRFFISVGFFLFCVAILGYLVSGFFLFLGVGVQRSLCFR